MSPLAPLFQKKLIPWSEDRLDQRLIVAKSTMKIADVPFGVELARRNIPGKRVIKRQRYPGHRIIRAVWPEAQLHELENPKLVCVIKGTTDFTAGNYYITCSEGHFLLLPPLIPNAMGGRSHLENERRRNGYCEIMQITPDRDALNISYSISRGEIHQEVRANACSIYHLQALRLLNDFIDETLDGEPADIRLQGHLLSACFLLLQREILANREVHRQFIPANTPSIISSNTEINDYIKAHLKDSLTIEKVARRMYMSPRQFTRHLRQKTGLTFVQIHTACRIEEAKRLLQETSWSVGGIAIFLGFKSVTYFNAFFTRHVGCTPGAFREKQHKK